MNEMSLKSFNEYWLAITPLEAEKSLNDLNISSYPHITSKTKRRDIFNYYKRLTTKFIERDSEPAKFGRVMETLKKAMSRG